MNNALKKTLSIVISVLMIATMIPFAFAQEDCLHESYTNGICDNCEAECEHPENELVWTEQLAATCVPGKETAVCGICGYDGYFLCDSETYPESEHDYAPNFDYTWTFSYSGAVKYVLKFSAETRLENGFDYIYIYDDENNLVGNYKGQELSGKEIIVEGSSFAIRLDTDLSNNYYGFRFDSIKALVDFATFSREIPAIEGYAHNWENEDGICARGCGAECSHVTYTNGICDTCAYACPHDSTFTDYVCDICKLPCVHGSFTGNFCDVCGFECDHEFYLDGKITTDVVCTKCNWIKYASDDSVVDGAYHDFPTGAIATFGGHGTSTDEIVGYYIVETVTGEDYAIYLKWGINQGYTGYGKFKLFLYHNGTLIASKDFTKTPCGYTELFPVEYSFVAEGELQEFKFVFKKVGGGTWADTGRTVYVSPIELSDHTHEIIIDEEVPATCTETGLNVGQHCNLCENRTVVQTVADALGHDWSRRDGICARECGEICAHETYTDDICDVCGYCETPELNADGYYMITKLADLVWFECEINKGNKNINAILLNDIDLKGMEWKTITETGLYYTGYGEDYGFAGVFDGNGHVIKNYVIKSSSEIDASVGLFGTVSGTIKNLGVENVSFIDGGKDIRAGAIVGQLITANGLIENCYASNVVITPGEHVTGAIAGCAYEATIRNCHVVNSQINGSSRRYGYIVGDTRADNGTTDRRATVTNCYTDGSILASSQMGIVENSMVLSSSVFESGEVAYRLNGNTSEGNVVWYQTLGEDEYPVFAGKKVYFFDSTGYGNCNHNPLEAVVENDVKATCTEDGSYELVVYCANCSKELSRESKVKDMLGHDWDKTESEDNLVRPYRAEGGQYDGYYTFTCKNGCGKTMTESVKRADYTEWDKVNEAGEAILADETVLDSVKMELMKFVAEYENDQVKKDNCIVTEQAELDAFIDAFKVVVEDVQDRIENGEAVKADYTEIDEAVAGIDEALENATISEEMAAELADIKAELDELKADDKTSVASLADSGLNERLEAIKATMDACANGTHSFTNYSETLAPKCEEEGIATAYCDYGCGATDEKAIEPHGHSFTEYTYNEDAECVNDGTKTASCDYNCGAEDVAIAEGTKLGHVDDDHDDMCDRCDEKVRCSYCGDIHKNLLEEIICLILEFFHLVAQAFKLNA